MSVVPPGAKGTTIFTGLVGHAACARTVLAVEKTANPAQTRTRRRKDL
jgi:hypothetical protein